jgi:hypothetical protein
VTDKTQVWTERKKLCIEIENDDIDVFSECCGCEDMLSRKEATRLRDALNDFLSAAHEGKS